MNMPSRRLVAVAFILSCAVLHAATGYEQITVANTAIGFTSTKINPSAGQMLTASCRLETAEIRWTLDGTTPTTTIGTLLEPGDQLIVSGFTNLSLFRAIRTGATSGVLSCHYSSS